MRDASGLRGLHFPRHWHKPDPQTFGPASDDGFGDAVAQIGQYLAGTSRTFDVPLDAAGDDFHQRVWEQVSQIGYGHTSTYGEIAAQLGDDATPRQVGAGVRRNPLCVLVPCRRVVGRGGKLTGYAGGIACKRHLLELEDEHVAGSARLPS